MIYSVNYYSLTHLNNSFFQFILYMKYYSIESSITNVWDIHLYYYTWYIKNWKYGKHTIIKYTINTYIMKNTIIIMVGCIFGAAVIIILCRVLIDNLLIQIEAESPSSQMRKLSITDPMINTYNNTSI